MIHFDTSFLIRALHGQTPEGALLDQLLAAREMISMSTIAWYEFNVGPVDERGLAFARRLIPQPIEFTAEDAELTAEYFNRTNRRRSSASDCMIAAVAFRRSAKIATCNTADFRRFEPFGLILA